MYPLSGRGGIGGSGGRPPQRVFGSATCGELAPCRRRRHAPAMLQKSPDSPEAPTDRYERRAKRRGRPAGRRRRRGRARTARRAGGGRRGRLRRPALSRRPQRFQEADARPARAPLRGDPEAGLGVDRHRQPRAHRPHEHPQGLAVGDEPGGRRPLREARSRSGRRQHGAARPCLRLRDDRRRRPPVGVDRRRLDRRQGDARPADDRHRAGLSRLRLRAAHGLFDAGPFRRAETARPLPAPPAKLRAGARAAA